jgi:RNA polymerase sigma factor (TIGR02999 family)
VCAVWIARGASAAKSKLITKSKKRNVVLARLSAFFAFTKKSGWTQSKVDTILRIISECGSLFDSTLRGSLKRIMHSSDSKEITQLLAHWSDGHEAALSQLMPIVYQELRKIADSYLRRERADHTLQPTALIHEAYLRLIDQSLPHWQNRAHFFGVAAQLMRQILVEHARAQMAQKRGGDAQQVELAEALTYAPERASELVKLDDALNALAEFDARKSRLIELRYFGGLSVDETAHVMGLSPATVSRDQKLAQAWLRQALQNN